MYFWFFTPNGPIGPRIEPQPQKRPAEQVQSQNKCIQSITSLRPTGASGYQRLLLTREDLVKAGGYDRHPSYWTQQEDKLLLLYRDKREMQWDEIAQRLQGRTKHTCYNRYKRIKHRVVEKWSEKDDRRLVQLIDELGQNWTQIGKHLTKWKPEHIREHYLNHLRPGLSQDAWTLEEDVQLVEVLNRHDFDWAEAQKAFPQRSLTQIKNRFKSRIRKLNQLKIHNGSETQKAA